MEIIKDMIDDVTACISWEKDHPSEDALRVLSRLGVRKVHLSAYRANPALGTRRLAEIGTIIRDAGLEVATYSPSHELGENSPDALPLKIEAAKAVGTRAVCLSLPRDRSVALSSEGDEGRQNKEDFLRAKFLASDWEKARIPRPPQKDFAVFKEGLRELRAINPALCFWGDVDETADNWPEWVRDRFW